MGIILRAREEFGIEGVTLSGGEPILQKGLPLLLRRIHEEGMGIILFSGRQKGSIDREIVENVDLLMTVLPSP